MMRSRSLARQLLLLLLYSPINSMKFHLLCHLLLLLSAALFIFFIAFFVVIFCCHLFIYFFYSSDFRRTNYGTRSRQRRPRKTAASTTAQSAHAHARGHTGAYERLARLHDQQEARQGTTNSIEMATAVRLCASSSSSSSRDDESRNNSVRSSILFFM